MLLAESFGQRLLSIFTALSPFYVAQPHTKPLPCINAQQFAAKVISKDQQPLYLIKKHHKNDAFLKVFMLLIQRDHQLNAKGL